MCVLFVGLLWWALMVSSPPGCLRHTPKLGEIIKCGLLQYVFKSTPWEELISKARTFALIGMTINVFFWVAAPFTSWSGLRSLAHLRSPTGKQGSSSVWSYNLQWVDVAPRMPTDAKLMFCMGMPGRVHPSSRAVTDVEHPSSRFTSWRWLATSLLELHNHIKTPDHEPVTN